MSLLFNIQHSQEFKSLFASDNYFMLSHECSCEIFCEFSCLAFSCNDLICHSFLETDVIMFYTNWYFSSVAVTMALSSAGWSAVIGATSVICTRSTSSDPSIGTKGTISDSPFYGLPDLSVVSNDSSMEGVWNDMVCCTDARTLGQFFRVQEECS